MLVIRIWNYFRGYVIIKIEGLTLERFINLSIAKGIYLWDIVSLNHTTLEAKIGIKGFRELRDVVRRVGCRVTIVDKRGYPFVAHKIKYRKMLAFGFIIALGIVFFLTSFIWSIEIIGNSSVDEAYILQYLEAKDIKTWVLKSRVNTDALKKHMLYEIDQIKYARAEIIGTKLIIEIKEREKEPQRIDKNIPCDIVADKKAVIEKIIAKNGASKVEKGDIVKEGEVLISGFIQDERLDNPLLVHSEGEVIGRTWYTKTFEEPIVKIIKEETGRVHVARELKILNKRFQSMTGEIPFKDYIEEIKSKKLIGDTKESTIEIILHEYKEVTIRKVQQNVDGLKKMVAVKGTQEIMGQLSNEAKVLGKEIEYEVKEDVLITRIKIEVLESIGVKRKIVSIKEE